MAEQWIIRVEGKEYGPADLELLREWKAEGRVLASNEARRAGDDRWVTADDIAGLFEVAPPPVQTAQRHETLTHEQSAEIASAVAPRKRTRLIRETFRLYFRGFWQYLALTVLAIGPSICGRLTGSLVESTPNVDLDLRTLVAAAASFCMFVLGIILWPVYLAGIQILTTELESRRRISFLQVLNDAVVFWPRIMGLCIIVYGIFLLLMLWALAILAVVAGAPGSPVLILIAMVMLVLQVWAFGRFFINVLFWQQCAVLEGASVVDSLRRSKELARSGHELPWFRRPKWRGAFIASVWVLVVCAFSWPALEAQVRIAAAAGTTDLQALLPAMQTAAKNWEASNASLIASIGQAVVRPMLGIAFVLLYFDTTSDRT